jgi:hypothetical protein
MALARIDVVVVSSDDDSPGTAGEAFHAKGLHKRQFGTICLLSNP